MGQGLNIAVVGIGGIFPGASNSQDFWHTIKNAVSHSANVPEKRWLGSVDELLSKDGAQPDKSVSAKGCFITGYPYDEINSGNLSADFISTLDPLVHLTLIAGQRAYNDCIKSSASKDKTGVILGSIALPTETSSAISWELFGNLIEKRVNKTSEISFKTNPYNAFVNSIPAFILSKTLEINGPCFTLDAACASSLYAIKLACDKLSSKEADLMLAGGVSRPDCLYTAMGFTQLSALSPDGICAPFDTKGKGLVIGEGAGIVALKRLADAVKDGDKIYGVIQGIGLSNDLEGKLLSPSSEGQLRAMRFAYSQAGWSPWDIDLFECHATGTPVGDKVEFTTLNQIMSEYGRKNRDFKSILASTKANIGHLLTGAGGAGLIKVLLCMQNNTLPPMANYSSPSVSIEKSDFEILNKHKAWPQGSETRKAAVSAFGFGGINAHILLEEYSSSVCPSVQDIKEKEEIAIIGCGINLGDYGSPEEFKAILCDGKAVSAKYKGGKFLPQELSSLSLWDNFSGLNAKDPQIPYGTFKIPPAELQQMLPQQLLMLDAAGKSIDDAGLNREELINGGVFIGINFDFATTDYNVRWNLQKYGKIWAGKHGYSDDWIEKLKDAFSPALNANRTMGALGSIVASRIAREFKCGGPSFTVSSEENSSMSAFDVAVNLLRSGEIDVAVAGGADISSDARYRIARFAAGVNEKDGPLYGEGAASFVLKRKQDAIRDGNKIYALIKDIGISTPPFGDFYREKAVSGLKKTTIQSGKTTAFSGSLAKTAAFFGAASTAASAVKISLMLSGKILPEENGNIYRHWLRNRAEGPREVSIESENMFGQSGWISFEEFDPYIAKEDTTQDSFVFFFAGKDREALLSELSAFASEAESTDISIRELAFKNNNVSTELNADKYRVAVVASSKVELVKLLKSENILENSYGKNGIYFRKNPLGKDAKTAFVFPGSGNHYAQMGREMSLRFPEVLCRQDRDNLYLKEQIMPEYFWNKKNISQLNGNHPALLQGQVAMCTVISDIVSLLKIKPSASIGYSLGEMAGIFSLRVWHSRDEMMRNMKKTNLFTTELATPYNSVKKAWDLKPEETVDWMLGVVNIPAHIIKEKLRETEHVYLLIINTHSDCVIGGDRKKVMAFCESLNTVIIPIEGVTTVHCEVLKPVAKEYRDFHYFPATPVKDVTFYSTGWGRSFEPTSDNIADAILAQASDTIDFPAIIEKAWSDGIRIFIEVGPDNSCTRMIDSILAEREHLAVNTTKVGKSEILTINQMCASLFAEGLEFNYGKLSLPPVKDKQAKSQKIKISLDAEKFNLPQDEGSLAAEPRQNLNNKPPIQQHKPEIQRARPESAASLPANGSNSAILETMLQIQNSIISAHQSYLDFSNEAMKTVLEAAQSGSQEINVDSVLQMPAPEVKNRLFMDREACMEFAVGSIAKVLGPEFAEVDSHPTRVRLPDEPLMLVDRIITVEGTPNSMKPGRVITEHDVKKGAWYLDNGHIPTCIAVEAGQADLFLSGYLGIDLITKGLAVYRLLDATITFHDHLPAEGETIRYDIKIERFFTQGSTWLFHFNFESSVNGKPLMSMKNGCAGFFSQKELDEGKGIIHTALDLRPMTGKLTGGFEYPVEVVNESYSDIQLQKLRRGNFAGCFGSQFANINIKRPLILPENEKMKLVDRVLSIEPEGGRYGLGKIRAQADIHADDWFLTCHFSDDNVMPGTLMYECCMHTFRIFLMRMGWVDEAADCVWEPIPGNKSSLKCRGQVIETTKTAEYEISIKEIGYNPHPYAIADALMYADGRPVVEMLNMSVQLLGSSKERIDKIWHNRPSGAVVKEAVYDNQSILAFSQGNPSEAFGDRYKIFDGERKIARLPRPPYKFLDRVTEVNAPKWEMKPAGEIEAQYDIPENEWYFGDEKTGNMPFAVLLEVALQPCGWLAAYAGSALTSQTDLSFRNLGGEGIIYRQVTPESSLLNTRVRMTNVSNSAGMIIQHYDFYVTDKHGPIYKGNTYFGFFSKEALKNQVGIRDIKMPSIGSRESEETGIIYPQTGPFPKGMIKMVDKIEMFLPHGGPMGLGYIMGTMKVRPDDWFFKAHFYQDPVIPGSLGLESMIQLMKYMAFYYWSGDTDCQKCYNVQIPETKHTWIYRGQVIPSDNLVTVQAWVKSRDDKNRVMICDGFLSVDGRNIYQMNDFTINM